MSKWQRDAMVDEMDATERFSGSSDGRTLRGMTGTDPGSALVTVVFVDIEGSTALVDRLGDEAGTAAVGAQLSAVRERIEPYGGREVKSPGDGLTLTFSSPRLAVSFALASQRALAGTTPRVRIGINTGEVLAAGGDPVGGAVNAPARIAARADGGEVLVSEVVRQLVGSAPAVRFVDRGRCRLKGSPIVGTSTPPSTNEPGVSSG